MKTTAYIFVATNMASGVMQSVEAANVHDWRFMVNLFVASLNFYVVVKLGHQITRMSVDE